MAAHDSLSDKTSRTPLARTSATMVQPAQRHLPVLGQTPLLQGMLSCSAPPRDNTTAQMKEVQITTAMSLPNATLARFIQRLLPLASLCSRHREARKASELEASQLVSASAVYNP
jgi:hypothetical protein